MARPPKLYELSSIGTDTIALSDALPYAQRARAVALRPPENPKDLEKLTRIVRLKLVVQNEVPPIVGALEHLRSLSISGKGFRALPTAIFALPRLESLFVEHTEIEDLDALERSDSLTTVIFRGTPLEQNADAREALLARLRSKGWEADSLFRTNGFSRRVASSGKFAAKNKDALISAINADAVPDSSALDDADLSDGTFADALVRYSLKKANLRNTTWLRCDFERTEMNEANLEGAVFDGCVFDDVAMASARAAGATFKRCELRLDLTNADVSRAIFTENESSPNLDFAEANAQGMVLDIVTASESSLDVQVDGTDLRGATIRIDITARRREELAKKRNARVKWAKFDTSNAELDERTTIEMTPLPGASVAKKTGKKADTKVNVDAVEHLGRLSATNAAMWFLAMDAKDAAAWNGDDEDEFDRALDIESGDIQVGAHHGVLAELGDCGWSHVWRMANGDVVLVEHHRSGTYSKLPEHEQISALRERIAAFSVPKKTTRIGKVSVKCGVLALMLPYCNGDFTDEQLSTAAVADNDRLLVRVSDGDYEVSRCPFAERGFEDEFGSYGDATRIAKVTRGAAKSKGE